MIPVDEQVRSLVEVSDPDRVQAAFAICTRFFAELDKTAPANQLEMLERAISCLIETNTSPFLTRQALYLRGLVRLQNFEIFKSLALLYGAVADLRLADTLVDGQTLPELDRNLATALVRLGEQSGDPEILRDALARLDLCQPFKADEWRLANAWAVARSRLGTICGDSQLVEGAVRDLQAFFRSEPLPAEAKKSTLDNIAILLLENARQVGEPRIYRSLIEILTTSPPGPADWQRAHALGSAQLELSGLERDPDLAVAAIKSFERLVADTEHHPLRQLEFLHSLGQAHFRAGKLTNDPTHFETAVTSLERALSSAGSDDIGPNARRHRLLADLGAYTLAVAWSYGQKELIPKARDYYENARTLIGLNRSPGVFIQVSKGLFELLFRESEWAAAASVGDDIARAQSLLLVAPWLTHGVYDQAFRELSGLADKRANCLLKLSRTGAAGAVLEAARGQRMVLSALRQKTEEIGSPDDQEHEITAAVDRLKQVLIEGDDTACRHAWDAYLNVRRKLGLDPARPGVGSDDIARNVPANGVYIQLTFSIFASHALIWRPGATLPDVLPLPPGARAAIGRVFEGEGGLAGWIGLYEKLLNSLGADSQSVEAGAWDMAVETALTILSQYIMEPVASALDRLGLGQGVEVLISPPGDLALLPLASAECGGRAVSLIPNLQSYPRAELASAETLVCLHAPDDAGVPNLPYSTQEVSSIRSHLPDAKSLEGSALTLARVIEVLASARYIHVASHAVYDADRPSGSGLILSKGARLDLTRLAAAGYRRFPARLVFLSCCEGAMTGRTTDYDQFVGLAGSLLELGVQAVVAAQWVVADDAAMVFAARFYRYYLDVHGGEAMSAAQAMQRSRIWMRSVTVTELISQGYVTLQQAHELFSGYGGSGRNLRIIRPRLRRAGEPGIPVDGSGRPGVTFEVHRPYCSPTHWAAWTLVGR